MFVAAEQNVRIHFKHLVLHGFEFKHEVDKYSRMLIRRTSYFHFNLQ